MFVNHLLVDLFFDEDPILLASLKGKETIFPPFQIISFSIQENYYCPFCRKKLKNYSCNCNGFKHSLRNLQRAFGDYKHELNFFSGMETSKNRSYNLCDLDFVFLSPEEIEKLGSNFFDDSNHCKSYEDCYKLLGVLEDDKLSIYVKNLKTEQVYRCEMSLFYRQNQIRFGKNYCDNKKFSDWNVVCLHLFSVNFG